MQWTDPLSVLFGHNTWANLRLLECCQRLTDEQLDTAIVGAYGTIRDMLRHIVTSEQSYVSRISTGKMLVRADDPQQLTLPDLVEAARVAGQALVEWANTVRAEDTVSVDWDGTPRDVPKSIILTQVVNHATEHRAQIMVTMTQLGVEPPDLQSWAYFEERDG